MEILAQGTLEVGKMTEMCWRLIGRRCPTLYTHVPGPGAYGVSQNLDAVMASIKRLDTVPKCRDLHPTRQSLPTTRRAHAPVQRDNPPN